MSIHKQQMKLLLFILSLMAGSEWMSEGTPCKEEWIKFICNTKTSGRFQMEKVVNLPQQNKINPGKLIIKQPENTDNDGKKKCDTEQPEFEVDKDGCPQPFNQTAYRNNDINITCESPEGNNKPAFFCKEDNSTCQNILKLSPKADGRISLTNTGRGVNISISHVSSRDAGVYWCGVKSDEKEFSLRQIHLEVKDGLEVIISITVCVTVFLLLLIALIIIYKRNGAARRHVNEGRICEERQRNLQNSNSISISASDPTNHTASLRYAAINFQVSPEKAGGRIVKPSSACEYSVVTFSNCPADLTVAHPHRLVK